MITTVLSKDHALWDQIVKKECSTKKRFEFLTGQSQAKNFFSGSIRDQVDGKMNTWDKTRAGNFNSAAKMEKLKA